MATRQELREELQRRLQDTVAEKYTTTVLNTLLNSGLRYVQKEILKIDPEAFFEVARTDIVAANLGLYEKPTNMIFELALKLKDTSTGKYNRIERRPYYSLINRDAGGESFYAHHGAFFYISPEHSSNIAQGIELVHAPILSMAADADVPILNINLHEGIYLAAGLAARGHAGAGKTSMYEEDKELLSLVVNNIPLYYKRSAADATQLEFSSSMLKDY